MEYLLDTLYGLDQRNLISTISDSNFNGKALQPFQIACLPKETTNLDVSLNESFSKMAPDKSSASSDQNPQNTLTSINLRILAIFMELSRRIQYLAEAFFKRPYNIL